MGPRLALPLYLMLRGMFLFFPRQFTNGSLYARGGLFRWKYVAWTWTSPGHGRLAAVPLETAATPRLHCSACSPLISLGGWWGAGVAVRFLRGPACERIPCE